jgi:ABC-type phosphate transport system permease subunit
MGGHEAACGGQSPRARPTSVTVIGWVWVVLGTMMTFSALMGLVIYMVTRQAWSQAAPPANAPEGFRALFKLFDWFPVLASAQVLLSPFIAWSGVQFLRLRRWARTSLEIINWLALAYVIAFSIFFVYAWNSMQAGAPQKGDGPPAVFALFGTLAALFNMALFGFPLGLMIRYLRSQAVREACSL